MAFPRIGGRGIPLSLSNQITNAITLQAGQTYIIPSGTHFVSPGPYTSLQFFDPVSDTWRTVNAYYGIMRVIDGDDANWRLANLTGCPVGALISNAGTGLTNGFGTVNVIVSSGGSTWQSIVGGAVNTTVTITNAGTGYTYPPTLTFSTPSLSGPGGIQATGLCAVTGGAITSVTVTNQGAGYTLPPTINVTNDPRDTTGVGAVLTAGALVGSGQLTALVNTNQGTPLTAAPTFTFSPASTIAVTAVMNFVVTGMTINAAGTGTVAMPFSFLVWPKVLNITRAANTAGPIADIGLTMPRPAWIVGVTTAGGALQTAGSIVADAGFGFQAAAEGSIQYTASVFVTEPYASPIMGGITDTSFLQPM